MRCPAFDEVFVSFQDCVTRFLLGFYWVSETLGAYYWMLLVFRGILVVLTGFYRVVPGFTQVWS